MAKPTMACQQNSTMVHTDETICLGMLFQSVMGKAIKVHAWSNLRFRIGGMAFTAEAAFTATEDTDVVVCSLLRGGGRAVGKGSPDAAYSDGGGGVNDSYGYKGALPTCHCRRRRGIHCASKER